MINKLSTIFDKKNIVLNNKCNIYDLFELFRNYMIKNNIIIGKKVGEYYKNENYYGYLIIEMFKYIHENRGDILPQSVNNLYKNIIIGKDLSNISYENYDQRKEYSFYNFINNNIKKNIKKNTYTGIHIKKNEINKSPTELNKSPSARKIEQFEQIMRKYIFYYNIYGHHNNLPIYPSSNDEIINKIIADNNIKKLLYYSINHVIANNFDDYNILTHVDIFYNFKNNIPKKINELGYKYLNNILFFFGIVSKNEKKYNDYITKIGINNLYYNNIFKQIYKITYNSNSEINNKKKDLISEYIKNKESNDCVIIFNENYQYGGIYNLESMKKIQNIIYEIIFWINKYKKILNIIHGKTYVDDTQEKKSDILFYNIFKHIIENLLINIKYIDSFIAKILLLFIDTYNLQKKICNLSFIIDDIKKNLNTIVNHNKLIQLDKKQINIHILLVLYDYYIAKKLKL